MAQTLPLSSLCSYWNIKSGLGDQRPLLTHPGNHILSTAWLGLVDSEEAADRLADFRKPSLVSPAAPSSSLFLRPSALPDPSTAAKLDLAA